MPKERIDKLMVERGLADSRTRAQALILAGQVLARDQRIDKPGHLLDPSVEIRIKGETLRYASRGGLKLEAALREFKISPNEKVCIDVGASTGGFTDCLLQQGAQKVWAVDVGHNQLVWRLRQDPRVVSLERVNARELSPDQFPLRFQIATVDVSFISLALILPALYPCLNEAADCVVLVKPQFEVGKGEVGRGGIVTDAKKHREVLRKINKAAITAGFGTIGLIASPILGAEGNREFLMHLKTSGTDSSATPNPTQLRSGLSTQQSALSTSFDIDAQIDLLVC